MFHPLRAGFLLIVVFLCPADAFAQGRNVSGEYLVEYGEKLYKQGDLEDARHEFSKALLVDPGNEKAKQYLNKLGMVDGWYQPVKKIRVSFPSQPSSTSLVKASQSKSPQYNSEQSNSAPVVDKAALVQNESLKETLVSQAAQLDAYKDLNQDYQERLKEKERLLAMKEMEGVEDFDRLKKDNKTWADDQLLAMNRQLDDMDKKVVIISKPSVSRNELAARELEVKKLQQEIQDLNDTFQKKRSGVIITKQRGGVIIAKEPRQDLGKINTVLNKQANALKGLQEKYTQRLKEENQSISQKDNEILALRKDVDDLSSALGKTREELLKTSEDQKASQGVEPAALRELEDQYTQQLDEQNEALSEKENEILALRQDVDDLSKALEKTQEDIVKTSEEQKTVQEVERAALTELQDKYTKQLQEENDVIRQKENERISLQEDLEDLSVSLEKNQQELLNLSEDKTGSHAFDPSALEELQKKYTQQLVEQNDALSQKENEILALKKDVSGLGLTLEKTQEELLKMSDQKAASTVEPQALRELQNKYADRLKQQNNNLDQRENEILSLKSDVNELSMALAKSREELLTTPPAQNTSNASSAALRELQDKYAQNLKKQSGILEEKENEILALRSDMQELVDALEESRQEAMKVSEVEKASNDQVNALQELQKKYEISNEALAQKENELLASKNDLNKLSQTLESTQEEAVLAVKAEDAAKAETLDTVNKEYIKRIQQQSEDLQKKEMEVASLKAEIESVKESLEKAKIEAEESVKNLEEQNAALDQKEKQILALKNEVNDFSTALAKSKEDVAQVIQEKEASLLAKAEVLKDLQSKYEESNKALNQKEDEILGLQKTVNKFSMDLEKSKADLQQTMEEKKSSGVSEAAVKQLQNKYEQSHQDLEDKQKEILALKNEVNKLSQALEASREETLPAAQMKDNSVEQPRLVQLTDDNSKVLLLDEKEAELKALAKELNQAKADLAKEKAQYETSLQELRNKIDQYSLTRSEEDFQKWDVLAKTLNYSTERVDQLNESLLMREFDLVNRDHTILTKERKISRQESALNLERSRGDARDAALNQRNSAPVVVEKGDEAKQNLQNQEEVIRSLNQEILSLKENLEQQKVQLEAQENEEEDSTKDIKGLEENVEKLTAALQEKEEQLKANLANLSTKDEELLRKEKELQSVRDELAKVSRRIDDKKEMSRGKADKIKKLNRQMDVLIKELQKKNSELEKLLGGIEQVNEKNVMEEKGKQISAKEKELQDIQAELVQTAAQMDDQKNFVEEKTKEFELLNAEFDELNNRLTEKTSELERTENNLNEVRAKKLAIEERAKELAQKEEEFKKKRAEVAAMSEAVNKQEAKAKARSKDLQKLQGQVEKLSRGKRASATSAAEQAQVKAKKEQKAKAKKQKTPAKEEKLRSSTDLSKSLRDMERKASSRKVKANEFELLNTQLDQLNNRLKEKSDTLALTQKVLQDKKGGAVQKTKKLKKKPALKESAQAVLLPEMKKDKLSASKINEADLLSMKVAALDQKLKDKKAELNQTKGQLEQAKENLAQVPVVQETPVPEVKEGKEKGKCKKELSGLKQKLAEKEDELSERDEALELQKKIIKALNLKVEDLNQDISQAKQPVEDSSKMQRLADVAQSKSEEKKDLISKISELECPSTMEACQGDMYTQECLVALIKRKDSCIAKLKDKLAAAKKIQTALERQGPKNCSESPEVKQLQKVISQKQAEIISQDLKIVDSTRKVESMEQQIIDAKERRDLSQRIIEEKDGEIQSLSSQLQKYKIKCQE